MYSLATATYGFSCSRRFAVPVGTPVNLPATAKPLIRDVNAAGLCGPYWLSTYAATPAASGAD